MKEWVETTNFDHEGCAGYNPLPERDMSRLQCFLLLLLSLSRYGSSVGSIVEDCGDKYERNLDEGYHDR